MPDEPKGDEAISNEPKQKVQRNEKDEPSSGSYYYDDAHGYENFDPDERDDEED